VAPTHLHTVLFASVQLARRNIAQHSHLLKSMALALLCSALCCAHAAMSCKSCRAHRRLCGCSLHCSNCVDHQACHQCAGTSSDGQADRCSGCRLTCCHNPLPLLHAQAALQRIAFPQDNRGVYAARGRFYEREWHWWGIHLWRVRNTVAITLCPPYCGYHAKPTILCPSRYAHHCLKAALELASSERQQ
jgi:hypothetical protein